MFVSDCALICVFVQEFWVAPEWHQWKGMVLQNDQKAVLCQRLEARMDALRRLFDGKLGKNFVPMAQILLSDLPKSIPRDAWNCTYKEFEERCPSFYLSNPASCVNMRDNEFAQKVPGLCPWIEQTLLESGITTIVLGGANLTEYIYKLALSLQDRYGSNAKRRRPRSIVTGKPLPRMTVVVDCNICGDYENMYKILCKDCFVDWQRHSYVPTFKKCVHHTYEHESAVSTCLKHLEKRGVRIVHEGETFSWEENSSWNETDISVANIPNQKHADTPGNQSVTSILTNIELENMRAVERELVQMKLSCETAEKKRQNKAKYLMFSAMRQEDRDAYQRRAQEHLEGTLGKFQSENDEEVRLLLESLNMTEQVSETIDNMIEEIEFQQTDVNLKKWNLQ